MNSPTTELEAVNMMLNYIGDPPVNSLDDIEETEAAVAYRLLCQTSREVQSQGHPWNTFLLKLLPDEHGAISVPENALKVLCEDRRYIAMGGRLYDRQENRYDLKVSGLTCEIVRLLEWSALPEQARNFILLSASRLFVENAVGSPDMVKMMEEQVLSADRELKDLDLSLDNPNLFNVWDKAVIARGVSPQNRGLPWR